MTEEKKAVDEKEAMRVIQEQQQKRITTCQAEIQAALQKHACRLTAEVILRQGQVIPNIIIVPDQEGKS